MSDASSNIVEFLSNIAWLPDKAEKTQPWTIEDWDGPTTSLEPVSITPPRPSIRKGKRGGRLHG